MTDWNVGDLSYERWVEDLEAVADTAATGEPMILLGISQGASICIDYAVRHPERVSRLLLYGAYARGIARREDPNAERIYAAIVELARLGWRTDNPAFRQVFTSRFIPDGTEQQVGWFNDLCRKTTTPEIVAELLRARGEIDVTALLPRVRTPTLVLHAREDNVCRSRRAAGSPRASPGRSSWSSTRGTTSCWRASRRGIAFAKPFSTSSASARPAGRTRIFATLSAREREILILITEGLANAQIAERLALSEKTVRNHVSNMFEKLGLWTRAQAIVFARDRGFRA
jgi:DNA-binding CsgD family transcriptional regulator/alpha-beta hydrolase superfamily lysophospholipase